MGKQIFRIQKKIALPAIIFMIFTAMTLDALSQNGSVGIGDDADDYSTEAILYLNSTTKGFLAPRVNSTGDVTATEGLLVYQTGSTQGFYLYTGGSWRRILVAPLPNLAPSTGLSGTTYDGTFEVSDWSVDFTPSGVDNNGTQDIAARGDHQHDPAEANLELLSPSTGIGGTPYDGTVAVSDWSVSFTPAGGNNGTDNEAARGDHTHDGGDLNLGTLDISAADDGLTGTNYDASGDVTDWSVAWPGSGNELGSANTVARSDHYHETLSPAGLITGSDYDGSTAVNDWDISLQTLTRGNGLTGNNYNGTSGTTWAVDFAGDGTANTASRSDHTHSPGEVNLENLTPGTGISGNVYDGTSPETWNISLPAHSITSGNGLTGTSYDGTAAVSDWAVIFAGSGSQNAAARSDHTHDNLLLDGDTEGQTLYWDNTASTWTISNYLLNQDGSQVRIGENGVSGKLSLYSDAASNEVTLSPNSAMTATVDFVLPVDEGENNQALLTDGSGNLFWGTAGDDGDWTISGNDLYSVPSGYVGIGTNNPNVKLDVNGSASFTGDVTVDDGNIDISNTTNTAGSLSFYEASGSGSNYTSFSATVQSENIHYTLPAILPSTGNIGFLQSDENGVLSWQDPNSTAWLLEGNSGTTAGTDYIGTSDDEDLVLKTNSSEAMRIQSGGNVGIGTDNPGVLMDVNGAASFSDDVTVTDGNIDITNTSNTAGSLSFMEASNDGTGNITSFSATVQDDDIHYVWPAEQGPSTSVSYLMNDGSGKLEWTTDIAISGLLIFQEPASVAVTTDDQMINTNLSSYIALLPDATPNNRTITLTDGTRASQLLVLSVVATGNNGVELANPNGDNLMLSTPNGYNLTNAHTSLLVWNGTHWVELSVSANED